MRVMWESRMRFPSLALAQRHLQATAIHVSRAFPLAGVRTGWVHLARLPRRYNREERRLPTALTL